VIISHKYQFIFFKTFKTAGTSIETYLSDHCGPDDVLTPFGVPVEPHRPRNHLGFFNHMSAEIIRGKIEADIWNGYFKFCVTRNSWDKAVSHYFMMRNSPKHQRENLPALTLDEYLASDMTCHNLPIYTDHSNGTILADKILHYENLDHDLQITFNQLGIAFSGSLAVRAKSEFRSDQRHYRDVLTTRQANRIAEIYADEIKQHGYAF
jgi:hypothetical protein